MRFVKYIMIILIFVSTGWAQNFYFVSRDGNDKNPGSYEAPWATIHYSAKRLKPGDVLYIREGSYPELVMLTVSGTPEAPIIIQNFKDETVSIDARNKYFGLIIKNCQYLHIKGLAIYGTKNRRHRDQSNIFLLEDPAHITFENCDIYDGTHGIYANRYENGDGPRAIQIINCRIHHNDYYGVFLDGKHCGAQHLISQNHIYENGWSGIALNGDSTIIEHNSIYNNRKDGITLEEIRDRTGQTIIPSQYNVIRLNEIFQNGHNGILTWQHFDLIHHNKIFENGWNFEQNALHGIYMLMAGNNIIFENEIYRHENGSAIRLEGNFNVIQHNRLYDNGIAMYSTDRWGPASYGNIIRYNQMFRNKQKYDGAIPGSGLEADGTQELRLYHNVFYDNDGYGWAFVKGAQHVSSGIQVKNNVLMLDRHEHIWVKAGNEQGYREDHNLIFPDKPDAINFLGQLLDYPTYQANTGQGAHSLIEEPRFAAPENGVFQLQPGSPGINQGGFITSTTDSGTGSRIPVEDVLWFCDGYGMLPGDSLQLEGQVDRTQIVAIDQIEKIITIDRDLTWTKGQGVHLPYFGIAPDMGALEYILERELSAGISLSDSSPLKAGEYQVTLFTNYIVEKVPTPLFLMESDSSITDIMLNGEIPGSRFTGLFLVDSTVANGPAHFFLADSVLMDAHGNVGHQISSGREIRIDQIPPLPPRNLRIMVIR